MSAVIGVTTVVGIVVCGEVLKFESVVDGKAFFITEASKRTRCYLTGKL